MINFLQPQNQGRHFIFFQEGTISKLEATTFFASSQNSKGQTHVKHEAMTFLSIKSGGRSFSCRPQMTSLHKNVLKAQ